MSVVGFWLENDVLVCEAELINQDILLASALKINITNNGIKSTRTPPSSARRRRQHAQSQIRKGSRQLLLR